MFDVILLFSVIEATRFKREGITPALLSPACSRNRRSRSDVVFLFVVDAEGRRSLRTGRPISFPPLPPCGHRRRSCRKPGRPYDGLLLQPLRHLRHQLADLHARDVGLNRTKWTTRRSPRLGIPRFQMTHATTEQNCPANVSRIIDNSFANHRLSLQMSEHDFSFDRHTPRRVGFNFQPAGG